MHQVYAKFLKKYKLKIFDCNFILSLLGTEYKSVPIFYILTLFFYLAHIFLYLVFFPLPNFSIIPSDKSSLNIVIIFA